MKDWQKIFILFVVMLFVGYLQPIGEPHIALATEEFDKNNIISDDIFED